MSSRLIKYAEKRRKHHNAKISYLKQGKSFEKASEMAFRIWNEVYDIVDALDLVEN